MLTGAAQYNIHKLGICRTVCLVVCGTDAALVLTPLINTGDKASNHPLAKTRRQIPNLYIS